MLASLCKTSKCLWWLAGRDPDAMADINGSDEFPQIKGQALFYQHQKGVYVICQANGLPVETNPCENRIFALHIHAGANCSGNSQDPFADSGTHFNPNSCPHPYHAGDFPPLFGNDGYAWEAFFTNRFSVAEIIGKTIIIHDRPDDFTTQPAGNSGKKIACGVIYGFSPTKATFSAINE